MLGPIVFLDEVDSTNTYAKDHLNELADGTLVVAARQTAGRGRVGRVWQSPENRNIYASYVMKRCPQPFFATATAGLAVLDTLESFVPSAGFFIKWPNDVYCRDCKICGILCESRPAEGGRCMQIVAGMGINVNMTPEELAAIDQPATSILAESGQEINLKKVIEKLAFSLKRRYIIYSNSVDEIFLDWKKANRLIGQTISVITGAGRLSGRVADLAASGELLLEVNGAIKRIHSGDVHIDRDSIDFGRLGRCEGKTEKFV